jgi:hypothetical protein
MKPTTKEIYIDYSTTIEKIQGKYAWDDNHHVGGIIGFGNGSGIEIGGDWWSTITGDCIYDSLKINGFKVYEIS